MGGSTLALLCFTISWSLHKLMFIESEKPCKQLVLCCPLLGLPSIFAASESFPMSWLFASIRVFYNESALPTRGPKCWRFSFCITLSNEYSRRISFRIDWFELPAVQGTLNSLLQHQTSKASILWRKTCFIIQLSHPSISTGKTIALTIWIFVRKVMS